MGLRHYTSALSPGFLAASSITLLKVEGDSICKLIKGSQPWPPSLHEAHKLHF